MAPGRLIVGILGSVAVLFVAPLSTVTANRAEAASAVKPHNVKLLINGKPMVGIPLSGSDKYVGIRAGNLRVEARWTTNARNTGHHVLIAANIPQYRVFRRCFAGTSCRLPSPVSIRVNQEISWTVKVVDTQTLLVVSGFRVCLAGRSA